MVHQFLLIFAQYQEILDHIYWITNYHSISITKENHYRSLDDITKLIKMI